MKVTLTTTEGRRLAAKLPYPGADRVEVSEPCACGVTTVGGRGMEIESHDTYRSDASCMGCGTPRGILRATMDTIFGLEEDEAVLVRGRCRVY